MDFLLSYHDLPIHTFRDIVEHEREAYMPCHTVRVCIYDTGTGKTMQVAKIAEMRELDRCAMEEFGIPGVVLMENAGRATVAQMITGYGPLAGRTVAIFLGPGNNGGDGLVIARHVMQHKGKPLLFATRSPLEYSGDAGINARIAERIALPWHVLSTEADLGKVVFHILASHGDAPVHCLVDALFGTGLCRPLDRLTQQIIACINTLREKNGWPVVAVDIPSGLHGDTGQTPDNAVKADLTVTYGLSQPAHWLHGGRACGLVQVADIGIPDQAIEKTGVSGELLDHARISAMLRPREKDSHKGSYGHLAILAGTREKSGAAMLAALGALHSGCGLVTLLVGGELNPIVKAALLEAMTVVLPGTGGGPELQDFLCIVEQCRDKKALVAGPGLGTSAGVSDLVLRLYRELERPMVVDADGLTILARDHTLLKNPGGIRILTPHPGEMARLCGLSTAQVQEDRLGCGAALLERIGDERVYLVLKGAGSLVLSSGGRWAINTTGNPGMAAGGMGDVLSGLIGGMLCQVYSPWESSCLAVYLHGLAADMLAREQGHGYLASEVARRLPEAMKYSAGQ